MHKEIQTNNSTGFTLIELLITTSLTVLLMLTITSMFMTFLIGNSKTNIKQTVKEEGLHAMNQMEFIMKNAHYVVDSTCTPGTSGTIGITGLDGGTSTYSNEDGKIASVSASSVSGSSSEFFTYLTSGSVTLSNLNFNCTGVAGNRQIVISFDLEKNAPTLSADSLVKESFQSTVSVRN
jgi:competence protein ComGC